MVRDTVDKEARTSRELAFYLSRKACIREPRPDRIGEGHKVYKKGWELRIVLLTFREVQEVRRLLARVGLKVGRSYR